MATLAVYLNQSKTRKDGSHPISLRLTVGSERRYIPISKEERFACTASQLTASGENERIIKKFIVNK